MSRGESEVGNSEIESRAAPIPSIHAHSESSTSSTHCTSPALETSLGEEQVSPSQDIPRSNVLKQRVGQPLIAATLAFGSGIAIDRYWPLSVAAWLALTLTWLVFPALWHITVKRNSFRLIGRTMLPNGMNSVLRWLRTERHHVAWLFVLLAIACFGGARHHLHWNLFDANDVGRFAGEVPAPVCVEVLAINGPRYRPPPLPDPLQSMSQGGRTSLRVRVTALRDGENWIDAGGRATLLVDGHLLDVHAGDRLRVYGQMLRVPRPANPGEFDFAAYKRADRELCLIKTDLPGAVTVLESGSRWSPRRWLNDLRRTGNQQLWSQLSHEQAGLASAVLLGAREHLSEEQNDNFLVTGTIHMLSISGLHVGILAYVLFKALQSGWVRRTRALLAVAIVTGMYTLLTDSEPPAVRAMLLVWIVCGSILLGRRALSFNSLAFAALMVLLINPSDLFRTGTQLSFVSMAVLTWLAPRWAARQRTDALTQLVRRTRPWHVQMLRSVGLRVVALTVAGFLIWAITLPLGLHRFGLVSFSALFLNVVLAVPVFLAMISGFAVLTIGWLVPPLGAVFAAVCDWNLWSIEWLVDSAARWPGSYIWIGGPSTWWVVGFYILLALVAVFPRQLSFKRGGLLLIGIWVSIGFAVSQAGRMYDSIAGHPSHDRLQVAVLSVGHGLAVVLELPGGKTILYDAGRLGSPDGAARSVEGYLRSRGIAAFDAVILSHADVDHYNGLPELLTKFGVGEIFVSPLMFSHDTPPLKVLRESIERSGAELKTLNAGDLLVADNRCRIEVLHPPADGVAGSDNANSLVLSIEFDGRRVLLTGDLEPPGVQRLLRKPATDCDVLLAPHHGSPRSDPAGLVNWSTPEWVIISAAATTDANLFAPYHAVMGDRVLCTAPSGTIRIRLSRDAVDVRAWKLDPW